MVKNECGQSGLWTLNLTLTQKRTDVLHANSCKLKGDRNILVWVWSKMGVGSLVLGLYLKNEQTEELIFCMLIQIHKN